MAVKWVDPPQIVVERKWLTDLGTLIINRAGQIQPEKLLKLLKSNNLLNLKMFSTGRLPRASGFAVGKG
ncbi:MAG: hypothetical protein GY859_34560 [Desulfobacterales bacterium]|nr:hypothetical protein [Desulfobacterales bacterium]